jgi:hypothetical protein
MRRRARPVRGSFSRLFSGANQHGHREDHHEGLGHPVRVAGKVGPGHEPAGKAEDAAADSRPRSGPCPPGRACRRRRRQPDHDHDPHPAGAGSERGAVWSAVPKRPSRNRLATTIHANRMRSSACRAWVSSHRRPRPSQPEGLPRLRPPGRREGRGQGRGARSPVHPARPPQRLRVPAASASIGPYREEHGAYHAAALDLEDFQASRYNALPPRRSSSPLTGEGALVQTEGDTTRSTAVPLRARHLLQGAAALRAGRGQVALRRGRARSTSTSSAAS